MHTGMVLCRGCGKNFHSTAPACPHCGALQHIRHGGKPKSRVTAGVLALLLGGIGVHRFYLGQWWGLFYALYFWTWIPAIASLIEGIVFLCTSDASWDAKYNKGRAGIGGSILHSKGSSSVAVAIVWGVVIAFPSWIAMDQYSRMERRGYGSEVRLDLKDAAHAQESYFDKNNSYKSCAACTTRNLPGFHNFRGVTLSAKGGRTDFVLVATHEKCKGEWTYQSTTGSITGPNLQDACKLGVYNF